MAQLELPPPPAEEGGPLAQVLGGVDGAALGMKGQLVLWGEGEKKGAGAAASAKQGL